MAVVRLLRATLTILYISKKATIGKATLHKSLSISI
jgi:hypothetical protein